MRNRIAPLVLVAVVLALVLAGAASAQEPVSPTGVYSREWSEYWVYIGPETNAGTRTLEVIESAETDPGAPTWFFRDTATGRYPCIAWRDGRAQCDDRTDGTVTWIDYPAGPDGNLVTQWFILDLEISGHSWGRFWEIGTRQTSAPPPPSPTVTFNLTEGQTVTGSVAVRMTANGLGAGAYRWYISVDGSQVAYRVESTTAITWWWNTGSLAPGTHSLSVRVVDASGTEARGSVNVRK